jgi:hypothetical protein
VLRARCTARVMKDDERSEVEPEARHSDDPGSAPATGSPTNRP